MDSYGELLKKARESKNLSYDTIAREISIDKKYLEGLEAEDNAAFPGEPYMIGFLKNYALYLNLDDEYLLKLYHNKKIQESPVPEGLLEKPDTHKKGPLAIIIAAAAVCVITAVVLTIVLTGRKNAEDDVLVVGGKKIHQYELTTQKFQNRLYKGDQLYISTDDGQKMWLTVSSCLKSFGMETPSGVLYTDLAEEAEYDINGDGESDLVIYVSDISSADESRGAEVSILLRKSSAIAGHSLSSESIPTLDEIESKHPQVVILEDNRAYPFTINAVFRAPCVFRYKIDNEQSVETYYPSGDQFSGNIQNVGIRMWMSNSNAVKFTVIADSKPYDLDLGKAGQVLVEDIKWVYDKNDGTFKLVVIELD
ncbi:MAG: helix-turn-helix domain-containing protein [Treponema sp.]|nr:helix-turn-helix domain-containing protein [Treponema sp.]